MPYYSEDSPDVYLTKHDKVIKGERSLRYYCDVWWAKDDPRNYSEWLDHEGGCHFRGKTLCLQEGEYVYINDGKIKVYVPIKPAVDYKKDVDWYKDRDWWTRNREGFYTDSKGAGHYAGHYANYTQETAETAQSRWAELRDAVNTRWPD